MSNENKNQCEIIDFVKYLKDKESFEIDEIKEDIIRLKAQIMDMLDEMESPSGPYLWQPEILNAAPELRRLMNLLEDSDEGR